jgi:hypothetical protein
VIQRRIVFTGDSLNDEPSALGFASKPACGHAAVWKSNLRRIIQSKRRIMPQDHLGEFSCHCQPSNSIALEKRRPGAAQAETQGALGAASHRR